MALELALEVIADRPVVVTDASGAIVHACNRAKKLLGYREASQPLSNTLAAFTGPAGAAPTCISVQVAEKRTRAVTATARLAQCAPLSLARAGGSRSARYAVDA